MIERRRKKRYGITLGAHIFAPWWSAAGQVFNISSSGLLFETQEPPPEPCSGFVRIDMRWPVQLAGHRMFLRCHGRVIWSDRGRIAIELARHEFRVHGNGVHA